VKCRARKTCAPGKGKPRKRASGLLKAITAPDFTPREVRTSAISYCSRDSSRCRLAKAGVYSYSYSRAVLLGVLGKCLLVCKLSLLHQRPQSSSASRFTAGQAGFLLLIQCGERPER
jgi:hypothetical protein